MVLFSQLTLKNVINSCVNLGIPKLSAAVNALTDKQKNDDLLFLDRILKSWQNYLMVEVLWLC